VDDEPDPYEVLEDLKGMLGAVASMSGVFHTLDRAHAGEFELPDAGDWQRLVVMFDRQRNLLHEWLMRLTEREFRRAEARELGG
jgi:hypothetical protein